MHHLPSPQGERATFQCVGLQCHLDTVWCRLKNLTSSSIYTLVFYFLRKHRMLWFPEVCKYHKVWVLSFSGNVNTCISNFPCPHIYIKHIDSPVDIWSHQSCRHKDSYSEPEYVVQGKNSAFFSMAQSQHNI